MASYCFADIFESIVDEVPDRPALIAGDSRFTFRELDEHINALAHHFLAAGIEAGDHIGVYAENGPEWVATMYAAYKVRAIPVNINYRYVEEELAYLFENADLVAVVFQARFEPRIDAVRTRLPLLRHFLRIEDGSDGPRPLDAVDYAAAVAGSPVIRPAIERSGDDIYMLYTGGTTGMPKGVMWRQEDVFFALGGGIDPFTREKVDSPLTPAMRIRDSVAAGGGPITMFPIPPLMHGAGQFGVINGFHLGNTVVLIDKFDPEAVWRLVERERINALSITGDAMARPLVETLLRLGADVDISSLISVNSTAAVFSAPVKEQFLELLPNILLLDAIGSTEGGMNGLASVDKNSLPEAGVARVVASRDATVLDDDGNPVEAGSGIVGKLARSGNIPVGYYKDPEKTAAVFPILNGVRYAVPGDYARIEADGEITLLGRGSQSINTGGEKVYPEEVEIALKRHPAIFDALVVGSSSERWGQQVTAIVQLRDGAPAPDLDAIRDHARVFIAGYKLPRRLIVVDAVPRLASGKPDYRRAAVLAGSESAPK